MRVSPPTLVRTRTIEPRKTTSSIVACNRLVLSAGPAMVQSFRHKGLMRFFESGRLAGIQPHHAKRLRMLLAALDSAATISDMDVPGFKLHPRKGQQKGRWSVWVNGNWRLTFEFRAGQALVLDYEDYH